MKIIRNWGTTKNKITYLDETSITPGVSTGSEADDVTGVDGAILLTSVLPQARVADILFLDLSIANL